MSGHRHTGGVRGTTLLRGICPACGREVAGGNIERGDARNSRIHLRKHNNPATGKRCAGSRDRVPTDWDRTNAWGQAKRDAERAWLDTLTVRPREDPTGCPAYENGLKTCQECGEQWV